MPRIPIPAFKDLPAATRIELQSTLQKLADMYNAGALGSRDGQEALSAQHARVTDVQRAINPRDAMPLGQVTIMMRELEARLRGEFGRAASTSVESEGEVIVPPTNTLPAPNHRINFAYYYPEYRGVDQWADVASTVNAYYIVNREGSTTSGSPYDPPSVWIPVQAAYVARAYNAGKRIHFLTGYNLPDIRSSFGDVLDSLAPYWDAINSIEVADEPDPGTSLNDWNSLCQALKNEISFHGLEEASSKSYSVSLLTSQATVSPLVNSDHMNRIGCNLYINPPGGTAEQNEAVLTALINNFKAHVPQSKNLHFTMQSYDRNGNWTNIPTLVALQTVYYTLAYQDPRVRSLWAFSYLRAGGAADHPELRAPHIAIYNAIHPLD